MKTVFYLYFVFFPDRKLIPFPSSHLSHFAQNISRSFASFDVKRKGKHLHSAMHFLCSAFEWWCLHPFWHPKRWSISILSRSHTMQMDVMESTKFNRTTEMHIFREREKLCMLMLCALCVLYSTASSIYISTITATANSFDNNTHHRHRHHCNSIFLFSSCIYFMSTLFAIAFATKANTHTI